MHLIKNSDKKSTWNKKFKSSCNSNLVSSFSGQILLYPCKICVFRASSFQVPKLSFTLKSINGKINKLWSLGQSNASGEREKKTNSPAMWQKVHIFYSCFSDTCVYYLLINYFNLRLFDTTKDCDFPIIILFLFLNLVHG